MQQDGECASETRKQKSDDQSSLSSSTCLDMSIGSVHEEKEKTHDHLPARLGRSGAR
jgi:hypothetical protein